MLALRLAQSLLSPWIPSGSRAVAFVSVLAGGLLIGHAWTFRVADARGWRFVGLGRDAMQPSSIALAAGLGAAAIAVPSLALLAVGWLRVDTAPPGSTTGALAASIVLLAPAALWEELLVRGYAFATLRERWGATAAVMATSVAFGALHFLNAGATPGALAVVVLAGIFLGFVLVRTGSLYAAWAAHLAWNVMLVVVLHATVSGLALPVHSYRIVDDGPDWATGGVWGPEGGVFAAIGLAVATWIIFRRPPRRLEPDA